ncbi:ATP-binding protein [Streptomyces sp. NPDC002067]
MIATRASSVGVPSYTETLPRHEVSVRTARQLVRTALAVWGLDVITSEGSQVVTELTANAVQHTRSSALRITIERVDESRVRVSVSDRSRRQPAVQEAGPDAVCGRGLHIVSELSDRWGTDNRKWGKVVWSELAVPPHERGV